jgi:short-subunit dehydrogenase
MALQGGGQILNVASIAAFQPGPWMSTYHASKAYVLHFSEALRVELKKSAIKVSVLCPGPTRTGFFARAQLNEQKFNDSQTLMSPEEVALYAVRALEKNRAIIIPGRRNRWLAALPRLGPRWLVRTIAGMTNKACCPR